MECPNTLFPSIQSTMNNLSFLFVEMIDLKDMYRLMCTSKQFALVAHAYIDAYIKLSLAPRISLYVEKSPVKFDGIGVASCRGNTTSIMFKLCRPQMLQCMPGSHEIYCDIVTGDISRNVSTTKSLLFHDFFTGLKSYTVCSPFSLCSSRKIYLTWRSLLCTDKTVTPPRYTIFSPDEINAVKNHHKTIPPTTYSSTMGYRLYKKVFRYLTRWRDRRQYIDSIPCITHITIDVPNNFFSIEPKVTVERFVAFILLNTMIPLIMLFLVYCFIFTMFSVYHAILSISPYSI